MRAGSWPPDRPAVLRGPRAWVGLLGVLLAAANAPGCTLSLEPSIACGDGFVDAAAGEQCDPGDPDSYINACVGTNRPEGLADCDPISCTIINDLAQCAVCGDRRVDESLGEQCDGDELNGRTCQGGVGALQCDITTCQYDTSECEDCGNGVLDEGEECDPNLDDLTMGKPSCAELSSPLGPSQPFTSGTPGTCRRDCRWERTGCGYCGNGRVDRDTAIDFEGNENIDEWCDGNEFDDSAIEAALGDNACTVTDDTQRPIVRCTEDCLDFIVVSDLPQPCCVKTGAACPSPDAPIRCCFEVDHPNSSEDPCQAIFNPEGNWIEACR